MHGHSTQSIWPGPPVFVSAALHSGHPIKLGEGPLDGFSDAGPQSLSRLPAEFRFELVHHIAQQGQQGHDFNIGPKTIGI
jgi:hypothetical protein